MTRLFGFLRGRPQLVAYLILAAGIGLSQKTTHDLVVDERAEDRIEEAQQCVTSWTAREDIRDAVERGTRGGARVGAESIIGVATDPDPEQVAQFRELIDHNADAEVAAARSEIPDPDCDLEAARRRLDD